MKSTTDYDMFKDFSSNRELDERHVRRLIKSISSNNLLAVNPIVVTNDLKVIDGQHRLEAARVLGVPIFYITGNITRKDISRLNSNQKNWSMMDYVNFYTIEGHKEFIELSRLFNRFDKISMSAQLALASSTTSRRTQELKQGIIDIDDIDTAIEVCEICYALNKEYGYEFVFDSRFPIALKLALMTENFKLENLYEKIALSPRSLVAAHTIDDYKKIIEDVYNYRLAKHKIKIK